MNKLTIKAFIIGFCLTLFPSVQSSAQTYQIGDVVESFSLKNRSTGDPVSLYDLEGKIVFLDWFAYWCPFCQSSAPIVEAQIVEYYKSRGGTPSGLEFIHVAVNLEANGSSSTQQFIQSNNFQFVLEDTDRSVAGRFQSGGQPIFAIINGVANTPGVQQWELLHTQVGFGSGATSINAFRTAIDSVPAAVVPPVITAHPQSLSIDSRSPITLSVTVTGDAPLTYKWYKGGALIAGATAATFEIPQSSVDDADSYEVIVTNEGGEITSQVATVEVTLGFVDSMIADAVPENLRDPEQDADGDGIQNLIEFLNRTDANDANSFLATPFSVERIDGNLHLQLTLQVDPEINDYQVAAQMSVSPGFETDFLNATLVSETNVGNLKERVYRSAQPLTNSSGQFARIIATESP